MAHPSPAAIPGPPSAAGKRPTRGESAQNAAVPVADAAPPQPKAPARSEQERQQDRKPVHPEPLLERVEETEGGKAQEFRNG
jgi:hypothetical protein